MANVYAVKSGNWSDTTVWNTGALPTAADDVYANNFTVTVDVSPTVLSMRNGAATGIAANGNFVPSSGITLTCTASSGIIASAVTCISCGLAAGQSCTIVANLISIGAGFVLQHSAAGTVNIVGNIAGSAPNGNGIGLVNSSSGIVNITGNCSGSSAAALNNQSSGTINITGNCTGGNVVGATNSGTGTINVTGTCTGGTNAASNSPGINNTSSGTVSVVGAIQSSATNAGVGGGSSSQVTVLTGPLIASSTADGSAAASGVNPCTATRWFPADTALTTFRYTMRGQTVSGSARPARDFYLSSAYDALYPVAANVRSGVTYGPGPAYTGTCAVPPAASVAVGVPVDDTTGTAAITAASIRAAVGLASANLDTQLSDIPAAIRSNLATELGRLDAAISTRLAASSYTAPPTAAAIASAVDSALTRTGFSLTSQERSAIATAVEQSILNDGDGQAVLNAIVGAIGNQNIDQIALVAAIRADLERTGGTLASRLASSAYTAPPSAADNASAVWSAGSRTITGGTVDTLTNAPTVPTPSQIATQVRTELSEELGRMDVATSSRLAASSYTAPPSAGTIATAVWSAATRTLTTAIDNSSTIAAAVWSAVSRTITGGTVDTLTNAPDVPTPPEIAEAVRDELEQELARMSNVATTQEVGAIVEGTFD